MNDGGARKWGVSTSLRVLAMKAGTYVAENRTRLHRAYVERLTRKRARIRATGLCWQPQTSFVNLPDSSKKRTEMRQRILNAHYTGVKAVQLPPSLAREAGLLIFGEAPCSRTVRRYVARIEACGGPELAPIEAYSDGKSCHHRRKARLANADTNPNESERL